jgi:hypothetical protein
LTARDEIAKYTPTSPGQFSDCSEALISQHGHMRLIGFVDHQGQAITTDLVMANRQHIPGTKPSCVGYDHVGRQNVAQVAVGRASRHLSGDLHQVRNFRLGPRNRVGADRLDAAERACTLIHHKILPESESPESPKHPAVVLDSCWRKFFQRFGEVGVDLGHGQIGDRPVKASDEDGQLPLVAQRGADMTAVQFDKLQQAHGVALREGKISIPEVVSTPQRRARSSVVYAWLAGVFSRDYPILRTAYLAGLTTFIFLRWSGFALTLLALGQLGDFIAAYRRLQRIRSKK